MFISTIVEKITSVSQLPQRSCEYFLHRVISSNLLFHCILTAANLFLISNNVNLVKGKL